MDLEIDIVWYLIFMLLCVCVAVCTHKYMYVHAGSSSRWPKKTFSQMETVKKLWKLFGTDVWQWFRLWFHKTTQVSTMGDRRCRVIFHSGTIFTWVFNICAACGVIIFQNACWAALLELDAVATVGPRAIHVGSAHKRPSYQSLSEGGPCPSRLLQLVSCHQTKELLIRTHE